MLDTVSGYLVFDRRAESEGRNETVEERNEGGKVDVQSFA